MFAGITLSVTHNAQCYNVMSIILSLVTDGIPTIRDAHAHTEVPDQSFQAEKTVYLLNSK